MTTNRSSNDRSDADAHDRAHDGALDNGDDDELVDDTTPGATSREPGGPYFGRLLIVLLLAVAFCGFMTWYLSSVMTD